MSCIPTLPGITSKMVDTRRLKMHVLCSGPDNGIPVLFIHGNASSATFWEEIMLKLPESYRGIAPDLRGYGDTEDKLIDATRGYDDWVDDLLGLVQMLGLVRYHIVGHSLGGGLIFTLIPSAGPSILSVTLVNPVSPYGLGGTKDVNGKPCYEDYAGSGGGMIDYFFWQLLGQKYRETDNKLASPKVIMNKLYWKPPFKPAREEDLLSSMLSEKVGLDRFPGDFVPSPNWPYFAPGKYGPINAASPKYASEKHSVKQFIDAAHKPPILWVRGSDDQIVSDNSPLDYGVSGRNKCPPLWPGDEFYPPQPMVSQTRAVLDAYEENGGRYCEKIIAGTGHTPYVEKPDKFMALLVEHLELAGRTS